jgi:hypothetical protein
MKLNLASHGAVELALAFLDNSVNCSRKITVCDREGFLSGDSDHHALILAVDIEVAREGLSSCASSEFEIRNSTPAN